MFEKKYNQFLQRFEEMPYLKYLHAKDFPGLIAQSYSFNSGVNRINGYFYSYPGFKENILVIFCHGIGGGHSSYMREIEMIAKHGYKVLAYDCTGCVLSEGSSINAFGQSLVDLSNAIVSIKMNFHYEKIYVIGHSWGAYATSNINNFQHVDKVVAVSPFISLKREYKDLFKFMSLFITGPIMKIEKKKNGEYASSSAIDALNKKDTNALVIASKDDNVINFKHHTRVLMKKVNNPKVKFVIYEDKMHNPLYTKEGVRYYNDTFNKFNQLVKEKKIQTLQEKKDYFKDVDFFFTTNQDEKVWQEIFQFLDK